MEYSPAHQGENLLVPMGDSSLSFEIFFCYGLKSRADLIQEVTLKSQREECLRQFQTSNCNWL
jgi:hypothetical protein